MTKSLYPLANVFTDIFREKVFAYLMPFMMYT